MYQKLKTFLSEDIYFYSVLMVIISVTSFGLGRVSMLPPQKAQQGSVILTKPSMKAEDDDMHTNSVTEFHPEQLVGSINGSKYHAVWCPGAAQIKEENKIYFVSESEAQAKGYTKARNCEM